jgi:hypothetical protein
MGPPEPTFDGQMRPHYSRYCPELVMPNGNPDFDFAECERFFAPLAATIQRFAARRNLALFKYYHEFPNWNLGFRHPIGGFGQIWLSKSPAHTLEISAGVWINDYQSFTRRTRNIAPVAVPMDNASLTAQLDFILDDVLSWPLDERFIAHGEYEKEWRSVPKSMLLASQPKWPEPVPGKKRR